MVVNREHAFIGGVVVLLLLTGLTGGAPETGNDGTVTFVHNGEDVATLSVDIADEESERRRGLMNRTIEEDEGMLFVFEQEDRYSFWMKNVPQPLDIIFISGEMEVVSIFNGLDPCFTERCPSYTPRMEAKFAVETLEGFAEANNIEIGDTVRIDGLN